MKKKLIIAQDIKELKYIISNIGHLDYICLPLSLEVQIYCQIKNIPFINLSKFSNNFLHKKIQNKIENIVKKNKITFLKLNSIKNSYYQWLEYKLTCVLFLYYFIISIQKKNKIILITSGWGKKDTTTQSYYFLSKILKILLPKINFICIDQISNDEKIEKKVFNYKIITNISKRSKKLILFTNLGYNLKNLFLYLLKKKYQIAIFFPNKINILKKFLLTLFNIYSIEISKEKELNKFTYKLPKIYFKKKDISNCIYNNESDLLSFFLNLENKSFAFKRFLKRNKFKLIISNVASGIEGSILEIGKKKNINTFNIPHGTISEYFNKGGKIFNKNIANAIFSKYAVNALQSNISKKFKIKYKINDNLCLNTGNLIFNYQKENKGEAILYAETNKKFDTYRCYGFQTFYEYLDNLKFLNDFASKNQFKIFVKPHPNFFYLINLLKSNFRNLFFTMEKNESLYKKIKIIISYSSSVIEDGLNSKIPIILFDIHNRYKHCKAETNYNKKNAAIYYINDRVNLFKCINTILKSNSINFKSIFIHQI